MFAMAAAEHRELLLSPQHADKMLKNLGSRANAVGTEDTAF